MIALAQPVPVLLAGRELRGLQSDGGDNRVAEMGLRQEGLRFVAWEFSDHFPTFVGVTSPGHFAYKL